MSVYVDDASYPFQGMMMCHMLADTPEELMAMADKIGVQRKWFQRSASTPHFDIAQPKRALAIAAGAVELKTNREVSEICERIRRHWPRDGIGDWMTTTANPDAEGE